MKKTISALLAASAVIAVAAPAAAQYGGQYRDGPYRDGPYRDAPYRGYNNTSAWVNINQRQAALERRIDRGVRSGQLTRTEAMRLRAEFRQIARLEARYRYTGGGLSAWERQDLDRRFDILAVKIRMERSDWDRRQYRGYHRW